MLAIVIPFYKLNFFDATLQSLSNQTDKRFKVYIGDDASQECPNELLDKYHGKFDFIYHRFDTNLGGISLTQQWERCIVLSEKEEWIMILGDDDVLSDNVVEEFYVHYDFFKGKSNLIRFATTIIFQENNEKSSIFTHPIWENANDFYYRRMKSRTRSSISEYFFSRQSYLKYRFKNYPLGWHSDDRAWLDFSDQKPIFSINSSVVGIGFSTLSVSGIDSNYQLKERASIQFYKELVEEKISIFTKKQRLELLLKYETAIKKMRKLNAKEWRLLFLYYVKYFSFISFIKLVRRIVIS